MYGSSKEDSSIALDNDVLVSHGWDVGSSSGAAPENDGDLRDSFAAHLGHVIEDTAEVTFSWKDLALSGQVGSS